MTKNDKSNHSAGKKNRKKLLGLITVLTLTIILLAGMLYINLAKNISDNGQAQQKESKLGTGGDVQSVENYNTQAISEWKSGDKKKARDTARQGLEEYKKLTIDQSKEIPGSIEVSYNLQMMSEGRSPAE